MRAGILASSTMLLALYSPSALAQHQLSALPLDDVAYIQLEALSRGGCRAARISAFRPYLVEWIREALGRATTESACQGVVLTSLQERLRVADTASGVPDTPFRAGGAVTVIGVSRGDAEFRPLWRDIRPADGTPPAVMKLNGRVSWNGGPNLFGVADAYAITDGRNDPTIRGRGLRGTRAIVDFEEASLHGRLGPLVVMFGRGYEAWLSEGRESLMLSAHGPPLDRLLLAVHSRRWEMRAIAANLPDVVLTPAMDSIAGGFRRHHRMIVGHALGFSPFGGFEVVLGETALLTREGGGVDLAFLNPAMIYLVTQSDTAYTGTNAVPANLTAFGSARWAIGRTLIGGELTVDDVQIDAKDRKNIPDQLAWRLHASRSLPVIWPSTVGLEYRRVDSYTYLRAPYSAVYQHYDAPLGSELGPGADEARVTSEFFVSKRLRLNTGVAFRRQGALRLEDRPSRAATGHAGESFPSVYSSRPAVQSARAFSAGAQWLSTVLPVNASVEWAGVRHVNNTPDGSANYLRVNFVGSYRFRYP